MKSCLLFVILIFVPTFSLAAESGPAAGVGLLGTARGIYTFGAHLKWMPAIALGYGLSILCHLIINARLFV